MLDPESEGVTFLLTFSNCSSVDTV